MYLDIGLFGNSFFCLARVQKIVVTEKWIDVLEMLLLYFSTIGNW